jgi:hypothetical protein
LAKNHASLSLFSLAADKIVGFHLPCSFASAKFARNKHDTRTKAITKMNVRAKREELVLQEYSLDGWNVNSFAKISRF